MKRPGSKKAEPKKVLKKPALAKKPALKEKPPSKAEKEGEEEGEEEEVKTDDLEMGDAEVTAKNLQTHQELLQAKLCSAKQIEAAVQKLPTKEQQLLWKKFEKERLLKGENDKYQEVTKGLGSQEKKWKLLRNFILDGGSLAKNYRTAMVSFEKVEEKGGEIRFNTWKQQVDKYGKSEALARLKAGTMKFRKSPTDPRFMEFADQTEYMRWKTAKKRSATYSTEKQKVTKDDWLSVENLALEEVGDESFGLKGTLGDLEMEPELKEFFKSKMSVKGEEEDEEKKEQEEKEEKGEDRKQPKKNKWEELSVVEKTDNKDSLLKKLMAFRTELSKEEASLTETKIALKGKDKKDELKVLTGTLSALSNCLKKIEKAMKAGCKKEESKETLLACFSALEKAKKTKKLLD